MGKGLRWARRYWGLLVILFLSLLVVWPLLRSGYFPHHDDLQVIRIFEMRRCLLDGQIPCRWVPDMGYGNGYPLFNYYAPLPYYLGAVFSFVIGYIGSAKLLFAFPLVLGGVAMFFLVNRLTNVWGGLVAGSLYLLAPYRALDVYVRGALNESWAIAVVPLVFLFIFNLSQKAKRSDFAGLVVALFIFLTSHNVMTVLFLPPIVIWGWLCFFVFKHREFKTTVLATSLGVGMSLFFLLPAFVEKNLVQTESLIRFELDYHANFLAVGQLFQRSWGYGSSVVGANDNMSFQVGYPHILVLFVVPFTLVWLLIKRSKKRFLLFLLTICYLLFAVSLFMTHNKSTFVWDWFPILKYTQFPWRFLALSAFFSSLLWGLLISLFKNRIFKVISLVLILLSVVLNVSYFRPERTISVTDKEKLSGVLWEEQQKGALLDYLPKTALEPKEPASILPIIRSGEAVVGDFNKKTNRWMFKIRVGSETTIEVPVFDFPNWQVRVNGKVYEHNNDNFIGRIGLKLSPGEYVVTGRLGNTGIRSLANFVTLVSLVFFVYVIFSKNTKIFK